MGRLTGWAWIGAGMLLSGSAFALGTIQEPFHQHQYTDPDPWQESFTKIPHYPKDDDLVQVPIDRLDSPFTYWMAPGYIENGADDVVRYMILLRSDSGSENAFYEGIRCETQEYKTYAFATRGQFQAMQSVQWQPVSHSGSGRYRGELHQYFLCDNGMPLSHDTIERRIRSQAKGGRSATDIEF